MDEKTFSAFTMPLYSEIPNVGLYLKQVEIFITEVTEPVMHAPVTSTMLSNYVKLHIIGNPSKKMYSRDQIAELLMIVLMKNVLSLENIRKLLELWETDRGAEACYDFFRRGFEENLRGTGPKAEGCAEAEGAEKSCLLQQVISTLVQKIRMDECFRTLL